MRIAVVSQAGFDNAIGVASRTPDAYIVIDALRDVSHRINVDLVVSHTTKPVRILVVGSSAVHVWPGSAVEAYDRADVLAEAGARVEIHSPDLKVEGYGLLVRGKFAMENGVLIKSPRYVS